MNYESYFLNNLKSWTASFNQFKLASFAAAESFDFQSSEDFKTTTKEWKEYYSLYKPLLIFSGDRKKFLDIDSYELNLERKGKIIVSENSGEGTAELYDFATGKTSRILFVGISIQIQEAVFTSDGKYILMVGRERGDSELFHPVIYLADLRQRKVFCFRSSNALCTENKKVYISRRFNGVKYQDE